METKTFTVDNILVLMTLGSDKKVYVKYFQNNQQIKDWKVLEKWQQNAIGNYGVSYCNENGLTYWSY